MSKRALRHGTYAAFVPVVRKARRFTDLLDNLAVHTALVIAAAILFWILRNN